MEMIEKVNIDMRTWCKPACADWDHEESTKYFAKDYAKQKRIKKTKGLICSLDVSPLIIVINLPPSDVLTYRLMSFVTRMWGMTGIQSNEK